MHLPEPNQFIAEDLSLKMPPKDPNFARAEPTYPKKLLSEEQGELFYKMDDVFLQPWAYFNFHLCSPVVLDSLHTAVALDLLVGCIHQLMVEDTYPADLAQLSFYLYTTDRGIVLKVRK